MRMPLRSRAKLLRNFALDHGYATAEFAVVLPAVVFVGALILWVFSLLITQFQIQSASYEMARNLARGQDISTAVNKFPSDFKLQKIVESDNVIVKISVRKSLMNRHVPWGIELAALATSQLEQGYAGDVSSTS